LGRSAPRNTSIPRFLSLASDLHGASPIMGRRKTCIFTTLLTVAVGSTAYAADPSTTAAKVKTVDKSKVDSIIDTWAPKPKLVALKMIQKYGAPHEVTDSMLVWHKTGAWKKTIVHRDEIPHDFPKPHNDILEQFVDYRVAPDKVDELLQFDGSITVHRTSGELSARCDKEEMNFLAINLANEIATGKMSVDQARDTFGKEAVAAMLGKKPANTLAFRFPGTDKPTLDADKPVIAGAPVRVSPMQKDDPHQVPGQLQGDPEIVAIMITANARELAALDLIMPKLQDQAARTFAQKLQTDHASGLEKALQLAQKAKITPIEGAIVDQMKKDGAETSIDLIKTDDKKLASTFVEKMVAGHQKTLELIDKQLLPAVQNADVKKALSEMRGVVSAHLEHGKSIRSRTSS
jgi:predicted outer membrane protein